MLIHLDEHEFYEAVRRLVRALRPGGALYISLKQDERASAGDGRVFRFWTMDEALAAIFDGRTPLERVEEWVSVDEGARGMGRVNLVGKRAVEPVSKRARAATSNHSAGIAFARSPVTLIGRMPSMDVGR